MDPGDILREAVAPGRGGTNIVQQGWQELVVKGDLRTNTKSDKYVNNQWTKKQNKKKETRHTVQHVSSNTRLH